MKTSSYCVWRAALIAVALAQAVAAMAQDLTAAPPNDQKLEVERHLTLAPQPSNPRNMFVVPSLYLRFGARQVSAMESASDDRWSAAPA